MVEDGCNMIIGTPGKLRAIFDDKEFNEKLTKNSIEYLIFGIIIYIIIR